MLPPTGRTSAVRFYQISAVLGLVWLGAFVPAVSMLRAGPACDFGQYYMGGLMVRLGETDSLYPIPNPDSPTNAGWPRHSQMRPRYAELAERCGVGDTFRYIHPPASALLFIPLSFIPFGVASWGWTMVMGVAIWWLGIQAAAIYRRIAGRRGWAEGWVMVFMALSPLSLRTLRTANITPLVAVCLGMTILALSRRAQARAAGAMAVAGLAKGASIAFMPLLLIVGCWRAVVLVVVCALVAIGISLGVMGLEPWRVFYTQIAPTLSRPSDWIGNQSSFGFLLRATGQQALPLWVGMAVRACGAVTFIWIAVLMFRRRRSLLESWPTLAAAAGGSLLTMLIFSAYAWEHYLLYVWPVAGYFVWEAGRSRWRMVMVAIAAVLTWCPFAVIGGGLPLPEPFRSHMLWGMVLLLIVCLVRLTEAEPVSADPDAPAADTDPA